MCLRTCRNQRLRSTGLLNNARPNVSKLKLMMAAFPRRVDDVSPRTYEVGVQATVDMRVIDTQTDTSLPTRVQAMWHCQVPTSIIDMSREQVADAGKDDSEDDESVAPI